MKHWLLTLALSFLVNSTAFAYYSVLETGTLVAPGSYRLTAAPQYIMSGDKGANISGRFDFGLTEELSGRALLGVGEVDVFLGGSAKWIPIPDYESQPAFGFITSVFYANYDEEDIVTFRVAPIISKQFETDAGLMTPYLSLPFGIAIYDSQTDSPFHLAVGTEFKVPTLADVNFLFELGVKLNDDSFSYITMGAAWDFNAQ